MGAPGDGSVFLNSMKLWAMAQAGLIGSYAFDLDLHAEVFEACAYHRWGLFEHPAQALATLILGGGVPKNYNLQPEPALGQVLGLPDVRGYEFDVQIVTAPVTDGSLSSCPPAEAVTWGKVDKDTYTQTTESMQADYSMVMPFLVKALLDNRARYERWRERMGEEALFQQHPKARGYLRPRAGYQLFGRRDELCQTLSADVKKNKEWLFESLSYPLASRGLRQVEAVARRSAFEHLFYRHHAHGFGAHRQRLLLDQLVLLLDGAGRPGGVVGDGRGLAVEQARLQVGRLVGHDGDREVVHLQVLADHRDRRRSSSSSAGAPSAL